MSSNGALPIRSQGLVNHCVLIGTLPPPTQTDRNRRFRSVNRDAISGVRIGSRLTRLLCIAGSVSDRLRCTVRFDAKGSLSLRGGGKDETRFQGFGKLGCQSPARMRGQDSAGGGRH